MYLLLDASLKCVQPLKAVNCLDPGAQQLHCLGNTGLSL